MTFHRLALLAKLKQKCSEAIIRTYHSMSQEDRCSLFLHLLVWPQWLLLHNSTLGSRDSLGEPNLQRKNNVIHSYEINL